MLLEAIIPGSSQDPTTWGCCFHWEPEITFWSDWCSKRGHLCCPNWCWQLCLMSQSQLVKKNHCSALLALQSLTLCRWRIWWGVIVWHCRESLDKVLGKKNNSFKQEEQWNTGRGCLGRRWWDLWKLRPLKQVKQTSDQETGRAWGRKWAKVTSEGNFQH